MTEETLVALLSQFLKPAVRALPSASSEIDRGALATVLAEAAWSGLVMLVRQSLATGEPAALTDIGHFRRTENEIRFVPAAALIQAASLPDTPSEAYAWTIDRALFYLREGRELLRSVPFDLAVQRSTSGAQTLPAAEKLIEGLFGLPTSAGVRLETVLRMLSVEFQSYATRLRELMQTASPAIGVKGFQVPAHEVEGPEQEETGEAEQDDLTPGA